MPTFVRAVNDDPDLALRAAANPLLALQELGYSLTDRMRRYAEHRVRFGEEDAARLTKLGDEVDKLAGQPVDLQSRSGIVRALGRVGVKVKASPKDRATPAAPATQSTTLSAAQQPPVPESVLPPDDTRNLLPVLEPLVGRHPIVEPLVAYLTLDATQPRLAPPEVYEALRARKEDPARTEVAVRFVLRNRDDG